MAYGDGTRPLSEYPKPPLLPPVTLDCDERYLVLFFLRRYITWCARAQHVSRARQAARLWRNIRERSHRTVLMRERLERYGR